MKNHLKPAFTATIVYVTTDVTSQCVNSWSEKKMFTKLHTYCTTYWLSTQQ